MMHKMSQLECFPLDLIIRNGRVVDPARDLDIIADVRVKSKRITCIAPHLEGKGFEEFTMLQCIWLHCNIKIL